MCCGKMSSSHFTPLWFSTPILFSSVWVRIQRNRDEAHMHDAPPGRAGASAREHCRTTTQLLWVWEEKQLCLKAASDHTNQGCANCLRCQPQLSSFRAGDWYLHSQPIAAAISFPPWRTQGDNSGGHTKAEEPNFKKKLRKTALV